MFITTPKNTQRRPLAFNRPLPCTFRPQGGHIANFENLSKSLLYEHYRAWYGEGFEFDSHRGQYFLCLHSFCNKQGEFTSLMYTDDSALSVKLLYRIGFQNPKPKPHIHEENRPVKRIIAYAIKRNCHYNYLHDFFDCSLAAALLSTNCLHAFCLALHI